MREVVFAHQKAGNRQLPHVVYHFFQDDKDAAGQVERAALVRAPATLASACADKSMTVEEFVDSKKLNKDHVKIADFNFDFTSTKAPANAKSPAAKKETKPRAPRAAVLAARRAAMHPSYDEMIMAAILMLKDKTGSSQQAIVKYLKANYNVPEKTVFNSCGARLEKMVERKQLTKEGSLYKLFAKEATTPKKKPAAKVAKVATSFLLGGALKCYKCDRWRNTPTEVMRKVRCAIIHPMPDPTFSSRTLTFPPRRRFPADGHNSLVGGLGYGGCATYNPLALPLE
jgi:hypothetical protein